MRVTAGGALHGGTVEHAGLRHLQGVFLVEISRGVRSIAPVAPDEVLERGDELSLVGRVARPGGVVRAGSRPRPQWQESEPESLLLPSTPMNFHE